MFTRIAVVVFAVFLVGAKVAPAQVRPPKAEMHVVAVNDSRKYGPGAGPRPPLDPVGAVAVVVDRPKQNVVLVLSGHTLTRWTVTPTPGTNIVEVILCGSEEQLLADPRPEWKVTELFYKQLNPGIYIRGAYSYSSPEFRPFVTQIHNHTNLQIGSFFGMSRPADDSPIRVDKLQDDPRLRANYPQPDWQGPLPKLKFSAVDVFDLNRRSWRTSYGPYSLTGPITKEHTNLPPEVSRVAELPEKGKFAGIDEHYLYFFDWRLMTDDKINLSESPAKLSWPVDINFDSKTGRVFVLSKQGMISSIDPKSREWKAEIPDRMGPSWEAFTFDADGNFVELRTPGGDEGRPHIVVFDRAGKRLKQIKLGDVFFPGVIGRTSDQQMSAQLRIVDNYAIIVTGPRSFNSNAIRNPIVYHYLVDLDKGTTNLVWRNR